MKFSNVRSIRNEQVNGRASAIHPGTGRNLRSFIIRCVVGLFACAISSAGEAVIEIPDPGLRAVIRATLKRTGDITASDMARLIDLDASRSKLGYAQPIQSLEGLQWAKNLQSLNLSGENATQVYLGPNYEPLFVVSPPDDYSPSLPPRPPAAALNTADLLPLADLPMLKVLNLSQNGLTNLAVPRGLENLQELDLSYNLQPDLTTLTNASALQHLKMRFCAVTNTGSVGALTNLRSLDLSFNYLPDFSVPAGLDHLEVLALDCLDLREFRSGAETKNLISLSLYMNSLTNTASLGSLTNLRSLNLSQNRMSRFAVPSALSHLEVLNLDYMGLSEFVVNPGATNLRAISLRMNALTNVVFRGLPRALRSLSLDQNPLSHFGFLKDLTALEDLSLAHCPVGKTNEFFTFWHMLEKLRHLDLSGAALDSLSIPQSFVALETLGLSFNPLREIILPQTLSNLKSLWLSGCGLSAFTMPEGLASLENLSLGYNQLGSFELPVGLKNLRSIQLSHNRLTSFRLPEGPSSVTGLDLSENPLTMLDLSASQGSLEHLDISFTRIVDLAFLTGFEQLQSLVYFDNLTSRVVVPDGLRRLKTLALYDWCPDNAKCLSGPQVPLLGVEFPASLDPGQLRIRGFSRAIVSVRGLWIHPPEAASDGQVKLRINGAAGRTVQVQRSADFVHWDDWQSVVLGPAGAELLDETRSTALGFFRVIGADGN